ncbi:MAG TPA: M23 family metallopeptidase [Acidobacteriota bacterium]|nr:M23 family metallopeptidase [Acidobacteriota bacterium]
MNQGGWTVIFARSGEGTARKFYVSRALLAAVCMTVLVAFLSSGLVFFHYFEFWGDSLAQERLLAERDELRRESQTFRVTARQLNDQMRLVETTARKLQMMSGMAEEGNEVPGVGGPAPDAVRLHLEAPEDLRRHFELLETKHADLMGDLSQLQDHYTLRRILLDSIPSIMPVRQGIMGDPMGYRQDPFTGTRAWHPGLDVRAPKGSRVIATADGEVTYAGWRSGFGKLVVIKHRFGFESYYGHLSKIMVEKGDSVRRTDVLGYVGSTGRATGNHVHFEVRFRGDSLDPQRLIRDEPL